MTACFFEMLLTHLEPVQRILISWESSVMRVGGTMLGCFQGVSGAAVWVEKRPHLFLCVARVFGLSARHCEFVPETQASALILCQMKGRSNNRPVSYFVISGNKWTSPKPSGCTCIFLFLRGSWEVRGWFFSAERVRLQIHPGFQSDGIGRTRSLCALHCLCSH